MEIEGDARSSTLAEQITSFLNDYVFFLKKSVYKTLVHKSWQIIIIAAPPLYKINKN